MGFDELAEKIKGAGDKEIADINKGAEKEVEAILKSYEDAAKQVCDTIIRRGEIDCDLLHRQMISKAKVEAKGLEAEKKSDILDDVFIQAKKAIQKTPKNIQSKIIMKLVKDGVKVGDEVTLQLDAKNITLVNKKELGGLFKKAKVEKADIGFGVVIESVDKKVRVDNTLDNVLEGLKRDLRSKVNKVLFENKK